MLSAARQNQIKGGITHQFWAVIRLLERFPLALLQLAFRIAVGSVFFRSGLLKLESWDFTVLLFRDEYKVPVLSPETAAVFTTILELGCPIFLFIGFGTRLATLPLLGMIFVIQTFIYPNAWSEHLMWASILLFLLTRGPGPISVDRLIWRRLAPSDEGQIRRMEPNASH
ncbi:MAG: DoxX family protein [Thermomicrobiales bacterium]|jgi:putative oxidoreductase|nr:DoxX family protein [Thermomicrobiales bacterium]